jgi:putative FmdB family regulatory protein
MGSDLFMHSSRQKTMPTYEYRCIDCNHKFEIILSYQEYESAIPKCPECGSPHPERIIKPVRIARSDGDRMESFADPAQLANLDEDPKTLGKMMRQMSSELGEDMGAEFNEVVDRLEKGQSPEDIEREIPDLGADLDP